METEILVKKIQNLLENRRKGFTEREDKEWDSLIEFRELFKHKHNAILLHFDYIKKIKNELVSIIQKIHSEKDFLMNPKNHQRNFIIGKEIGFKSTVFMEGALYHLISILDNLSKIIGVYFRQICINTKTFSGVINGLNHEHIKDSEVSSFVNQNYSEWIKSIKDFRDEITHGSSKICQVSFIIRMERDEKGVQRTGEGIIINVPQDLKDKFGYKTEDIEVEQVCDDILKKFDDFLNGLLDILNNKHKEIFAK